MKNETKWNESYPCCFLFSNTDSRGGSFLVAAPHLDEAIRIYLNKFYNFVRNGDHIWCPDMESYMGVDEYADWHKERVRAATEDEFVFQCRVFIFGEEFEKEGEIDADYSGEYSYGLVEVEDSFGLRTDYGEGTNGPEILCFWKTSIDIPKISPSDIPGFLFDNRIKVLIRQEAYGEDACGLFWAGVPAVLAKNDHFLVNSRGFDSSEWFQERNNAFCDKEIRRYPGHEKDSQKSNRRSTRYVGNHHGICRGGTKAAR